jgi:MscS family membrane protein
MVLEQISTLLQNQYIKAFAILIGFLIGAQVSVYIFERIVVRFTKKTKTRIDDLITQKVRKPIFYLIILFGLKLSLMSLSLTEFQQTALNNIIYTLIILLVTFAAVGLADILITEWGKRFAAKTKSQIDDALVSLFQRAAKVVIYVLGILYALDVWGVEVGPLMASLGIAGLAIAFALQSTLGNIFGGISLLIDKSVKVGDRIQLETGESGIVVDVGLRSTKIKTWTNDVLVIPNGKLADSQVQNFLLADKEGRKARVDVEFGVEYGSDVDHVEKVVVNAISKVKNSLKEPKPTADFLEMGDSALLFKAKFWVKDISERYGAKIEANKAVYNALNKENIVIPYPQMDVHIKKEHTE